MKIRTRRVVAKMMDTAVAKGKKGTPARPPREAPDDVTARIAAKLAQLGQKEFVVLAYYKASSGPDHEVRMGANGAVWCTGRCWQYSKTGSCKHLDHFRQHCVPQRFDRIEK